MGKGIVTDYPEICFICGRPSEAEHHLVFGTAGRELSEKDGLKVPVCNNCHNMGEILMRIHGNPMAERMSKIIGQLAWEKEYALQKADEFARIIDADREEGEVKQIIHKAARETFRKRIRLLVFVERSGSDVRRRTIRSDHLPGMRQYDVER